MQLFFMSLHQGYDHSKYILWWRVTSHNHWRHIISWQRIIDIFSHHKSPLSDVVKGVV